MNGGFSIAPILEARLSIFAACAESVTSTTAESVTSICVESATRTIVESDMKGLSCVRLSGCKAAPRQGTAAIAMMAATINCAMELLKFNVESD